VRSDPPGFTLTKDAVRCEANCADNKRQRVQRQRRRLWSATRTGARARGKETPSESESSRDDDANEGDDEEEGDLTSPNDLFGQQAGIIVGACQAKHPGMYAGGVPDLLPQSDRHAGNL
jgi:hypothetical protein